MADELYHLETIIDAKITTVRSVLKEEDRALVEEIVMKKGHSTDPSTFHPIQSIPNMIKKHATTKNSGRFISSIKSSSPKLKTIQLATRFYSKKYRNFKMQKNSGLQYGLRN